LKFKNIFTEMFKSGYQLGETQFNTVVP